MRKNSVEKAITPFYSPLSVFEVLKNLEHEIQDSWRPFSTSMKLVPETDMYEEKGQLVMKTELPGIDKKDLDIRLEGDRVTIKAEKKETMDEDTGRHTHERYYRNYFSSVTLPYAVKEDKITVTFNDGVLELRLPKAEYVKAKKIEIRPRLAQSETKKRERKHRQKKS